MRFSSIEVIGSVMFKKLRQWQINQSPAMTEVLVADRFVSNLVAIQPPCSRDYAIGLSSLQSHVFLVTLMTCCSSWSWPGLRTLRWKMTAQITNAILEIHACCFKNVGGECLYASACFLLWQMSWTFWWQVSSKFSWETRQKVCHQKSSTFFIQYSIT